MRRTSLKTGMRYGLLAGGMAAVCGGIFLFAQDAKVPVFKSRVDLVVLENFTVTDNLSWQMRERPQAG